MTISIVAIAGTRPEFIKTGPVLAELARRDATVRLVATGQHEDEAMARAAWSAHPSWPAPEVVLPWSRLADLSAVETAVANVGTVRNLLVEFGKVDLVLVQGDTASCLSGALAARSLGLPLAHLEAGLRSYDDAMPEEGIRRRVDALADLLLAPSALAAATLRVEKGRGAVRGDVVDVGQTGLDALEAVSDLPASLVAREAEVVSRLCGAADAKNAALLTLHRAALDASTVRRAIRVAASECRRAGIALLVAEHPRWGGALRVDDDGLDPPTSRTDVLLVPPLSYGALSRSLWSWCDPGIVAVFTDSGGLCEEAWRAGVPVACLRPSTERWELAERGVPFADPAGDPEAVADACRTAIGFGRGLRRTSRSKGDPYAPPTPGVYAEIEPPTASRWAASVILSWLRMERP